MRVANKLTPEQHGSGKIQKARGSGATLRTLEITKSVKATIYTELFYTAKAKAR